ncbi:MAG: hypothetical protein KBG15_15675 [Kofleriaceae bacterium]|nr:hypothetical protein [Kofleriaceae bacterium]
MNKNIIAITMLPILVWHAAAHAQATDAQTPVAASTPSASTAADVTTPTTTAVPPRVSSENPIAPSPWGSSQYVVPYQPPIVKASALHTGFTLELFGSAATTSLTSETSGGGFALGWWISQRAALTFRLHQNDNVGFVGGAVLYRVANRAWIGGGVGKLSEYFDTINEYGWTEENSVSGIGAMGRVGYNFLQGGRHALYVSVEGQAGRVTDTTLAVGSLTVGYQLL